MVLMNHLEAGLFRTILALNVLGAPPTTSEIWNHYDVGTELGATRPEYATMLIALEHAVESGLLVKERQRYFPRFTVSDSAVMLQGEEWMPRKLRKAKRVAQWLARLAGVRAVFLCNRTAFGLPRDEGDLDFFVVVRHGSIWQTRGIAGLPFVLLGDRPAPGVEERDVVCLSFYVSDAHLDLSACALGSNDVYLRHWFLGLLPLVDDGVGAALWQANNQLRLRHPYAQPWIPSPDMGVSIPRLRIPMVFRFEKTAQNLQWRYFPHSLRQRANQDTQVMISDHLLKFHLDDGRETARMRYEQACVQYGVTP